MRFLDIYQVTDALNAVLTNQKQLAEMRRSWEKINFESVRNQSALVCNCRHEDLIQLLEVEFRGVMDGLPKSTEPVRDVMAWADKCCERLMGPGTSTDERGTMSSRSVLIRWGYVTSQVMRDLVRYFLRPSNFFRLTFDFADNSQRSDLRPVSNFKIIPGVCIQADHSEDSRLMEYAHVAIGSR